MTALPFNSIHGAAVLLARWAHLLSYVCPFVYPWVGLSVEGESKPGPTPGGV